jgi:uncharacterized protein (DUF1778 family)
MCAAEAYISGVQTTIEARKNKRFVARVTEEDKQLFQKAAAIEGRSMAKFIIAHVREVALQVINQSHQVRLDARQSRLFVDALLAPPRKPTAALKQAMTRYRRQVTEA